MGNQNRSARIMLARIYGSGCMFKKSGAERYVEKLGTIKTYKRYKEERRYTSKKIKALESLMTYHHLKHKSNGGKPTIENGAILSALVHQYIHSLPRNQEELINDYLREYKRSIDHNELPIEFVEELESPIVITGGELDNGELTQAIQVDFRNNTMQVKKLSKADKKREQRAKKKAEEKQKAKEKRRMQKLRKLYEDR